MDPLTILQTLSEAISLATTLAKALYFICTLGNVPAEINKTKDDISSLLILFQFVKSVVEDEGNSATYIATLDQPNSPLHAAIHTIKEMAKLLGGDLADKKPREEVRVMMLKFTKLTLEDAKWPWKQKKIRELLERLESQKTSINMVLETAIRYVLGQIPSQIVNLLIIL
jgi:hypothetical protein